jgi:hypothetical protein
MIDQLPQATDLQESDVLDYFPQDRRLVHLGFIAGHNIFQLDNPELLAIQTTAAAPAPEVYWADSPF